MCIPYQATASANRAAEAALAQKEQEHLKLLEENQHLKDLLLITTTQSVELLFAAMLQGANWLHLKEDALTGSFKEAFQKMLSQSGSHTADTLACFSEALNIVLPSFYTALDVANKFRMLPVPPSITRIEQKNKSVQLGSRKGSLRLMVRAELLMEMLTSDIDTQQWMNTGNFMLSEGMSRRVLLHAKQMQVTSDAETGLHTVTLNKPSYTGNDSPRLVISAIEVGHLHAAEDNRQASLNLHIPPKQLKESVGTDAGELAKIQHQWREFLMAERAMEFTRMQNDGMGEWREVPKDWNLGEIKSGLDLPAVFWAHMAGDGGDAANSKRRKHAAIAGLEEAWTGQWHRGMSGQYEQWQWPSHAGASSWQRW